MHGGILSGPEIERCVNWYETQKQHLVEYPGCTAPMRTPLIGINPFTKDQLGPNSYDVRLADKLLVYESGWRIIQHHELYSAFGFSGPPTCKPLDMRSEEPVRELTIPPEGLIIYPGILYLGSTVERTVCSGVVPWLDGRSSVGRLGMQIHATAGRGDDGFGEGTADGLGCTWTLEITVTHPLRIYSGERVGQLSFFTLVGERAPYRGRYKSQVGPVASRLWQRGGNEDG